MSNFDPVKIEEEVLDFWKKNHIYFKAQLKALKEGKQKWFYLDGPPYVNADIHAGHAFGRSLRDPVIRFFRRELYKVYDRPGFDTHGLPIEVMTEKKLGLKSKEDIKKFGETKFIEECKKLALENMEKQIRSFKRLGVWKDYNNPYFTLDNNYIERVWEILKRAWEKGDLYKGKYVLHWCPRCQTALAPNYEVVYKEVEDPSIFVKFPVKGEENTFFLIWTTTPWTLPFNLGIMVHPDEDYVLVELENGEKLYIAKARLVVLGALGYNYKILKEFKGRDLEGKEYYPPFYEEWKEVYEELKKKSPAVHTVWLSSEYVTMEEGTGLVHSAPGCGPEDYEVGRRYGVEPFNDVDEAGRFTREPFKGWVAKKDDHKFIELLKKKGLLFYESTIKHNYPTCERCKSKLIFRVTEQWFLRITKYKEKMIEQEKEVYWVPEKAKNAMLRWLENVRDWVISRQRYWGIPLPVWVCENGHTIVVGSAKELKELGANIDTRKFILIFPKTKIPDYYIKLHFGDFEEVSAEEAKYKLKNSSKEYNVLVVDGNAKEIYDYIRNELGWKAVYLIEGDDYDQIRAYPFDLHKPEIDNVEIKCPVCGAKAKRVSDVLDVWIDSGAAFLATFDNKEAFNEFYPVDFIIEGWDQIRGWFYSLAGEGMLYNERVPYKAVYVAGFVLDEKGEKMSKSKGNVISPWELFEKYGADATRLYMSQAVGPYQDLPLSFRLVKEKLDSLRILWNTWKYFKDQYEYYKVKPELVKLDFEEKYMLHVVNKAVKEAGENLRKYHIWKAPKALENAWLELSRFYIKVIRDKLAEGSEEERKTILGVILYSLEKIVKASSVVIPFTTEYIYQEMKNYLGENYESVHFTPFPKAEEKYIDERLEKTAELVKSIMEAVNAIRDEVRINVRWPLPKLVIYLDKQDELIKEAIPMLKRVLNVKEIEITYDYPYNPEVSLNAESLELDENELAKVATELAMKNPKSALEELKKNGKVTIGEVELRADNLVVKFKVPENIKYRKFKGGYVFLDTTLTEELWNEGFVREVIRRIQEGRKKLRLKKADRIVVYIETEKKEPIEKFKEYIMERVGAEKLEFGLPEKVDHSAEYDIKGVKVKIEIVKL